jgi:hypothetical protein
MSDQSATTQGVDDDVRNIDDGLESTDLNTDEADLEAGGEGDEADLGEGEEDLEEVEFEGRKYTLPKEVKRGLLREQDYTQKNQALAEERRAFQAQRASAAEADKTLVENRARLMVIDEQLALYGEQDWAKLWQENPARAGALQAQRESLREAKADLEGKVGKMVADRSAEAQRIRATRLQEAAAVVAKDIPGWSADLAGKLQQHAVKELGFTRAELDAWEDPRFMKLLHAAYVGTQATAQRNRARNIEQAQAQRPAEKAGGGRAQVRDPNRMSTDQWIEHRNQQLAKKGR